MIRKVPQNNVLLFHAGTAIASTGELMTAGGRVLDIVATGPDVESARKAAYSTIGSSVQFPGMQYRHDIGSGQLRRRKLEQIQT